MDPQVCIHACALLYKLLDLVLDPGTMQPLQAPRELLLQPFILCSAELFPNQRDAFLRLVIIFQHQSYQ
jgi:hypothetical protein